MIWTGRSIPAASVSGPVDPDELDVISIDEVAEPVIQDGADVISADEMTEPVIQDGADVISADEMTKPVIQAGPDEGFSAGLSEDGVSIDAVHFPDEIFRGLLDAFDKDRDGRLSEQEINDIKILDCDSDERKIENLEGIGYLKDLEVLLCRGNGLTSLDLSQNSKIEVLYCSDNQLNSLVIGDMPDLARLDCSDDRLTSLDLTGAPKLKRLDCKRNRLESLDLCSTDRMYSIDCSENAFTSLDLRNISRLDRLDCSKNELLSFLKCKNIDDLDCSECQLTSLEWEKVSELDCSKNRLAYLKTGRVTILDCTENVLTELDLSGSPLLKELDCSNNQLRLLDLTDNFQNETYIGEYAPPLVVVCEHNRLESIKLGKDNDLNRLRCTDNQLTSLDVENMKSVTLLHCKGNRFSVLDVSGLPGFLSLETDPGVKVTYVDIPRLVSLIRDKKGAKLAWEYKDKVCTGFDIYRKKGNSKWEKIKKIRNNSGGYTGLYTYTDKEAGEGRVTYTVRAIRQVSGLRIGGYDEKGLTAESALSAPKKLKVSPAKGKIKLTWTKVAKSSGYRIYRKTEKTEWKKIADVKARKTLYTDKGAKKGRTYSYRVQAYKKGTGKDKNVTVEGGYSAIKKARVS